MLSEGKALPEICIDDIHDQHMSISHQHKLRWLCKASFAMGFSPDTQNCGLHMRRECRERFPRHRLKQENAS